MSYNDEYMYIALGRCEGRNDDDDEDDDDDDGDVMMLFLC